MTKACLDNLDKCKASCCRMLSFNLNVCIGHPLEDYYRKHGLKVTRLDRNTITILVPNICKQLDTETNLCKLHDTGKKPYYCRALNKKTIQNGQFYITEGCIYGKKD